jgi:hypothetical protein
VLKPLAENRAHVTGFFHNAAISGEATAERAPALEESLRKFPATLHQIRLTSAKLKQFADQGTPLFTDINTAAPGLSKATVNLPSFAREGIPALQSLGDAGQAAGPKLVASDGLLTDLASTASSSVPVGQNFSAFLDTFTKTQGFQNLMDFIYNSVGSTNGLDAFGHFLRSNLQLTSCVEVAVTVQSGCEAFFRPPTPTTPTKKKKKKAKKAKISKAKIHAASPLPQIDVPNIQELIPQIAPEKGTAPDSSGSGTTTTTPDSSSGTTTTTPQENQDQKGKAGTQTVSMNEAQMFLQFLLGGGA